MRAAGSVVLILAVIALHGGTDPRDELPDGIGMTELLASSSDGALVSACASVIYRVSEATSQTVTRKALAFFRNMDPPRNQNPRNPYGAWAETPFPRDRAYALGALNGCGQQTRNPYHLEIAAALIAPGSFVAHTSNGEGMLVVAPEVKLAAFLYFG